MQDAIDVPAWRRMQHWLALYMSGFISVIGFAAIVVLGAYVSTAVHSDTIADVFFAAGVGFLGTILSLRAVEFYRMPVKIGYDPSAVYLEFRRNKTRRVTFDQISEASLGMYVSGWFLELETMEGERLVAGADPTDGFGKGLLESFTRFRESSQECRASVEMSFGFYPSRRIFVSIRAA